MFAMILGIFHVMYTILVSLVFMILTVVGATVLYCAAALHFSRLSPDVVLNPVIAQLPQWHTVLLDSYSTATFTIPISFSFIGLFFLNLGIGYFGGC